jgi:AcrR family transcriptional regulator
MITKLSRKESQQQTRARLIEAARTEIVKKGFADASIRDIADAAGYSLGAFYSNFESKEKVLLELISAHHAEERSHLEAALNQSEKSAKKVLQYIHAWIARVSSDADWAILAIELQLQAVRNTGFAAEYERLAASHRNQLGQYITKLFAILGKDVPGNPVEIAEGFMALGRGTALQLIKPKTSRHSSLIKTFVDALIAAAPPRKK